MKKETKNRYTHFPKMNETSSIVENNLENQDIILLVFLGFAFLASEIANANLAVTIWKVKHATISGSILVGITFCNAVTGLMTICPQIISMMNSTWLMNATVCSVQGVLSNVFTTSTSYLLLLHSLKGFVLRYVQTFQRIDRRISLWNCLVPGIILFSGLFHGVMYQTRDDIVYIPELMSCDIRKGMSVIVWLFTVIIPCLVVTVISPIVIRGTTLSAAVTPSRPYWHSLARRRGQSTNITFTDRSRYENLMASLRSMAIVQLPMAATIPVSFLFRILGQMEIENHRQFLRLSLLFFGVFILVQPSVILSMHSGLRKVMFDAVINDGSGDRTSSIVPTITQITPLTPRPRSELFKYSVPPSFLFSKEINAQVSNPDQDNKNRKVSNLSILSCEIQIEKPFFRRRESDDQLPQSNTESERPLSVFSTMSCDSVFIKVSNDIKAAWNDSSPSITLSVSDSIPSARVRSRFSFDTISSYSKNASPSEGSIKEGNKRRSTMPNFNINISKVHKILPQAWVEEKGDISNIIKKRRCGRSKSLVLGGPAINIMTPIESVGSLEHTPRVSNASATHRLSNAFGSSLIRPAFRISRLQSELEKLEEVNFD